MGLDRIDQHHLPLDGSYTYEVTANRVTAYVIDTGIRTTHATFGGRASWGYNALDSNDTDCNGHGTHVAGTIGGAEYGVAKGVRLVAVKAFGCDGSSTLAVLANSVDWTTANAFRPAVVNMSIGGPASSVIDFAVARSIKTGLTYSVSSGNDGADACNYSPARVATALTVNASDITDRRAPFSNRGTCTDLFAPGVDILSASPVDDAATATRSGTSMAAPHVTGAAALHLAANPAATPSQVHNWLVSTSATGLIADAGSGSPNRLLFTGVKIVNPGTRLTFMYQNAYLQLQATGGTQPYTWSPTNLPNGLTMNPATGLITGTPLFTGVFPLTITVTTATGRAAQTTFTWYFVERIAQQRQAHLEHRSDADR